jgi:hypothetical protein
MADVGYTLIKEPPRLAVGSPGALSVWSMHRDLLLRVIRPSMPLVPVSGMSNEVLRPPDGLRTPTVTRPQVAKLRRDRCTLYGRRFIQVALSHDDVEDNGGDM